MFRLPARPRADQPDGLQQPGAAAAAEQLRRRRARWGPSDPGDRWPVGRWGRWGSLGRSGGRPVVVGVNIGKTKAAAPNEAIADYVASARLVAGVADYLVVNVSSPNTPGLRDLQAVSSAAAAARRGARGTR